MITHLAIYKFKDGYTRGQIDGALLGIKELKNKVAGILDIYVGKNYSRWNEGYEYAIVVLAKNQKALDDYRIHPEHVALAKYLDEMEERGVGIDFEDMNL